MTNKQGVLMLLGFIIYCVVIINVANWVSDLVIDYCWKRHEVINGAPIFLYVLSFQIIVTLVALYFIL